MSNRLMRRVEGDGQPRKKSMVKKKKNALASGAMSFLRAVKFTSKGRALNQLGERRVLEEPKGMPCPFKRSDWERVTSGCVGGVAGCSTKSQKRKGKALAWGEQAKGAPWSSKGRETGELWRENAHPAEEMAEGRARTGGGTKTVGGRKKNQLQRNRTQGHEKACGQDRRATTEG